MSNNDIRFYEYHFMFASANISSGTAAFHAEGISFGSSGSLCELIGADSLPISNGSSSSLCELIGADKTGRPVRFAN